MNACCVCDMGLALDGWNPGWACKLPQIVAACVRYLVGRLPKRVRLFKG